MEETLEYFIRKNHTKQTANNYLYEINHFRNTNLKARWYNYSDIINYLEELKKKQNNVNTRIRILSAIKRYYDYLLETGQRNNHPCKNINIKKRKSQIQIQDLFSREELMVLLNKENRYKLLKIRNQLIISLLIFQALKSEDIIRLTVSDVNIDQGAIYIKSSTLLRKRYIEFDRRQYSMFYDYINNIRPKLLKRKTNKLIISKLGDEMTVDGIYRIFKQFRELYPDRQLNPKTIRQSTISYWLNVKKYLLDDVQDLAGHRNPSTTLAYKGLDVEDARTWIRQFHPLK